jgi:hypothetical protein
MIEITNRQKSPVQVLVRSRRSPRSFTTLNIPGIGKGNNIYLLEDERITDYIERVEKLGLISTRKINRLTKGE